VPGDLTPKAFKFRAQTAAPAGSTRFRETSLREVEGDDPSLTEFGRAENLHSPHRSPHAVSEVIAEARNGLTKPWS